LTSRVSAAGAILCFLLVARTGRAASEELDDAETGAARKESYWESGETRAFVAAAPQLGAVSSLELNAGYGKPYFIWGGLEGSALTTFDFGMLAVGPRVSALVVDVSLKRRWNQAYSHGFLPRRDSYTGAFVEGEHGAAAAYEAWDFSLGGFFPSFHGFGLYEFAATRVEGVPADRDLFEEWHRVVMSKDWVYAVRLGLALQLLDKKLAAGVLGEWLTTGDRGSTWRVGPLVDYQFTDHLSAGLVYTVPVSSPDSLGAWTGSWGTLRVRYTWASAESRPAFP
jgi:hypothetical protein